MGCSKGGAPRRGRAPAAGAPAPPGSATALWGYKVKRQALLHRNMIVQPVNPGL